MVTGRCPSCSVLEQCAPGVRTNAPELCSVGIGRNSVRSAFKETIKPITLPFHAFHKMLRLARASQVVVLAREEHYFGMQDKRRGPDVLRVFQRRSIPILIEFIEQEPFEIVFMAISAVTRAVVT